MNKLASHHGIQWVSHPVPNADGTDECRDASYPESRVSRPDVIKAQEGLNDFYRGIVDADEFENTRYKHDLRQEGWSSSYYELPDNATELQDLIEYREMNFALGNIFKACYRMGDKAGTSEVYDLNKIIFYAQRELRRIENEDRPGNSTS